MYVNDQGGYRESFQVAPPVENQPATANVIRVNFAKATQGAKSEAFQNCRGLNLSRTTTGYSETYPSVPLVLA